MGKGWGSHPKVGRAGELLRCRPARLLIGGPLESSGGGVCHTGSMPIAWAKRSRATKGLHTIRQGARKRGIPCTLTVADYRTLTEGAACHYCRGALPKAGGGLDRVDSSGGYTLDNVVPCCQQCNNAKGESTPAEFTAWALRLAAQLKPA